MFGYMTEIDTVAISEMQEIVAQGEDILSLLYHFLDEFLFLFSADPFFIARVSAVFLPSSELCNLLTQTPTPLIR